MSSSCSNDRVTWPARAASRHLRLLALVFLVYGAGALIGTVLQARSSSLLGWLPFVGVAAVVVNGFVRHRESRLTPS